MLFDMRNGTNEENGIKSFSNDAHYRSHSKFASRFPFAPHLNSDYNLHDKCICREGSRWQCPTSRLFGPRYCDLFYLRSPRCAPGDLCVWPSYASTIIFELWLRNFGALIWPTESYVRVIYIPARKDEQEKREKYNRRSVLAARDGKSSGQFTFTLCHLRGGVLDGSMRL